MDLPAIIGHRGAAGSAPENTLASFRRAAMLHCRWVEFDVRLTADGHPIVFHDDTLERTTTGHGPVAAHRLDEIRRLDAGLWFGKPHRGEPVPTLTEALSLLLELGLQANIEIKAEAGREAETARAALIEARRIWPANRPPPLVSSFLRPALAEARRVAPDWPRGLLDKALPRDWPDLVRELGCASINLDHRHVEPDVVNSLRQAGLPLLAYTVNDALRARTLWQWGVRSIFTDRPELLAAAP
jgi:glycerophosphoryl diester phosphodiesterase